MDKDMRRRLLIHLHRQLSAMQKELKPPDVWIDDLKEIIAKLEAIAEKDDIT